MRRVRHPVLAECGESARQAASKDSYSFLERAVRAFGSTRAPQRSRPEIAEPAGGRPCGAVLRGTWSPSHATSIRCPGRGRCGLRPARTPAASPARPRRRGPAYPGHPLYTYVGDTKPGEAKGNELNLAASGRLTASSQHPGTGRLRRPGEGWHVATGQAFNDHRGADNGRAGCRRARRRRGGTTAAGYGMDPYRHPPPRPGRTPSLSSSPRPAS